MKFWEIYYTTIVNKYNGKQLKYGVFGKLFSRRFSLMRNQNKGRKLKAHNSERVTR